MCSDCNGYELQRPNTNPNIGTDTDCYSYGYTYICADFNTYTNPNPYSHSEANYFAYTDCRANSGTDADFGTRVRTYALSWFQKTVNS